MIPQYTGQIGARTRHNYDTTNNGLARECDTMYKEDERKGSDTLCVCLCETETEILKCFKNQEIERRAYYLGI